MTLVALEYSWRMDVTRGVHKDLECGEGLDMGVTVLIRAVMGSSEEEDQLVSCFGKGLSGADRGWGDTELA